MAQEGELTVVIKGAEMSAAAHANAHRPWWSKGGPVLGIVGILAAMVPVTTGTWGLIQKAKETKLEELRLKHKMAMDFVDRVKDDARLRDLRLIIATSDDQALKSWAATEKQIIEAAGYSFEDKIIRQEMAYASARKALNDARESKADLSKERALEDAAKDTKAELDRLRAETLARGLGEPIVMNPDAQALKCDLTFSTCTFNAPDDATIERCKTYKAECLKRTIVDVP
jgi:hypothetical protein